MSYFLLIFSLVFLLSFTDFSKKFNNFGTNISIILLSMLAGFRNIGGNDFEAYRFLYDTGLSIGDTEVGYNIINTFFHNIGISYILLFYICFSKSFSKNISLSKIISAIIHRNLFLFLQYGFE